MLSRAHTRRSAVGRLKRPGRLLSCILNVVPQWHVKTWCRKVRWQLCCTTCCRRNVGQRDMLTTDRLDRSGAPKIGRTSGNEMRCPDHVVIEVETLQSFCRKPDLASLAGQIQNRKLLGVEPCISLLLLRRDLDKPGNVDPRQR